MICLAPSTDTGEARVAIHFDVDTVDSNGIVLGLGAVPNGTDQPAGTRGRVTIGEGSSLSYGTSAWYDTADEIHVLLDGLK